jgi:hypothetical protein
LKSTNNEAAWRTQKRAPAARSDVLDTSDLRAAQLRVHREMPTFDAAIVLSPLPGDVLMIGATRRGFVVLLCGLLVDVVAAAGDEPGSPASKSIAERNAMKLPTKIAGAYGGGELVELRVRDRMAYLIRPTGKADPQRRWLWDFPFWLAINDGFGHAAHRYYVEKALAAGFHIAGVDVGPSCGSPAAAEVCQEFYEQLVSKHGLHKRARVLAHSHGGLIAYGWAFRHPTCVDRIAGMCPATDFRTYPTLPNVVTGPTKGLDYGLSLEGLDRRAGGFNPVENLAPLAKAGAKILHLHGDKDTLVPTGANSTELARRYRELGGEAEIVLLKGLGVGRANSRGHDGPELYESAQLLKFLLADGPSGLRARGRTAMRAGRAKDGHPGHPLYVPDAAELIPFVRRRPLGV